MPKTYGDSPGFTEPGQTTRKRPTPSTPSQQQANTRNYLDHMIEADKAYHAQQEARGPVRGSSTEANAAAAKRKSSGKRQMTMRDMQIEKALKDSGA